MKKVYESKKIYSDKYNKSHKSIRIKKELYERLQGYIGDKNITIKHYIESIIEKSIK
jgi:predicted DNA-binding protein